MAPTTAKAKLGGLAVGDRAPDFDLPGDGAKTVKLSALKGRNVIVYFYPKDDTSGCTTQACGFNDSLRDLAKAGTEVIGISRDSVPSHDKFRAKHGLGFRLASDEDGEACAAYGTWVEKSMYGRKYMGIERSTFLVDGKGAIRGIWRKVKVPGHVDEVVAAARAL